MRIRKSKPQEASGQEDAVVVDELVEGEPDVESGLADAHRLQHARVAQLAQHDLVVEQVRFLFQNQADPSIHHDDGRGIESFKFFFLFQEKPENEK